MLPIPETIPFRLTRDILDPMGITGVDGVFQRCAQTVLQVMRQEQVIKQLIGDTLPGYWNEAMVLSGLMLSVCQPVSLSSSVRYVSLHTDGKSCELLKTSTPLARNPKIRRLAQESGSSPEDYNLNSTLFINQVVDFCPRRN